MSDNSFFKPTLLYKEFMILDLIEKDANITQRENHKMLFIPQGFAHGFVTLEDNSEVQYKVDNFYDPNTDSSIKYDDPNIGIKWPLDDVILSEKDINAPYLKDLDVNFK